MGAPNTKPVSATPESARSSAAPTADASATMASPAPMPVGSAASGNAGGTVASDPTFMVPGNAQPPQTAMAGKSMTPGHLTVRFSGKVPAEVWLVAVDGTAIVSPTLDAAGFTLGLAAGDYWLEIVEAGQRLRSRTPLSVPAGGERKLDVAVEAAQLVVEETVALDAQPTPEPTPTAAPTATP